MTAQRSGHNVASLTSVSLLTRCLNAVVAYGTYLAKTFVPYHLSVFYPHPGEHFFALAVVVAAALLTAVSVAAIDFDSPAVRTFSSAGLGIWGLWSP